MKAQGSYTSQNPHLISEAASSELSLDTAMTTENDNKKIGKDTEEEEKPSIIAEKEKPLQEDSVAEKESMQLVSELKEKANARYAEKDYVSAIELYTEALALAHKFNVGPTIIALLYSNRAAARCWIKAYSDALLDSEKALELRPEWTKGYLRKAAALVSLKRFSEAKESYLKWQEIDPSSVEVKRALTELDSIMRLEAAKSKDYGGSILEDLECPLCWKLFFEPVTTPCGHTFCRNCLLRALDHGAGCPICRVVVHVSINHPVTVTLQKLLNNIFPTEYEERKREKEQEIIQNETCLPLFLLNAVTFPHTKFPMHIFEARYRLMLRRCLEGDKIFGLVNCRKEGSLWVPYDIGCTLRITEVKPTANGRSHINTVAERRFKILEKWDQDGYMCGKVQWYDEEPVPENEKEDFEALGANIKCLVQTLLPKATTCSGVSELLARAGDMPSGGVELSYWLAGLLPLSSKVKQDLLEMKSTVTRLKILEKVLNCTDNSPCYVQ